MAKLLAFAGSARKDSINKKLLRSAAAVVEAAGGEVTEIDLRDYPMPIYDGDLEQAEGLPENAVRLYSLMRQHSGLLLACPEYNSSITPLLKNTIDWVSRPREGDPPLAAFAGKVAGLMSASPGALGGMRGLVHMKAILGNIGVIVLPNQVALPKAHEAWDADGSLRDDAIAKRVENLVKELIETTRRLAP